MAAKHVDITPLAERDIEAETIYLAVEAGSEVGIRFFDSAHATFQTLLDMPGMGKRREIKSPRIAEARQWPVSGFESYLIFYLTVPSGIEIVRVLHGARDIDRILNEET